MIRGLEARFGVRQGMCWGASRPAGWRVRGCGALAGGPSGGVAVLVDQPATGRASSDRLAGFDLSGDLIVGGALGEAAVWPVGVVVVDILDEQRAELAFVPDDREDAENSSAVVSPPTTPTTRGSTPGATTPSPATGSSTTPCSKNEPTPSAGDANTLTSPSGPPSAMPSQSPIPLRPAVPGRTVLPTRTRFMTTPDSAGEPTGPQACARRRRARTRRSHWVRGRDRRDVGSRRTAGAPPAVAIELRTRRCRRAPLPCAAGRADP